MGRLVLGLISSIPTKVSISATRPIHLIHALGRRFRQQQCGTRRTVSFLLLVVHVSAGRRHVGPPCLPVLPPRNRTAPVARARCNRTPHRRPGERICQSPHLRDWTPPSRVYKVGAPSPPTDATSFLHLLIRSSGSHARHH
jgi:hypothetical protein